MVTPTTLSCIITGLLNYTVILFDYNLRERYKDKKWFYPILNTLVVLMMISFIISCFLMYKEVS